MYPFSRPGFAIAIVVAIAITMTFFTIMPGIDIATSKFFYSPGIVSWKDDEWYCRSHSLGCVPALVAIRDTLHILPVIVAIAMLVLLGWLVVRKRSLLDRQVLRIASALAAFLIGGVVLINSILKPYWGRPRPYHEYIDLERFKDYVFVPVGNWHGACTSNCSFASGEAFALVWMACAATLLPARFRTAALAILVPVAIFGSGLRIAFGAHYLSDVLVAALLSLFFFSICAIAFAAVERKSVARKLATAH